MTEQDAKSREELQRLVEALQRRINTQDEKIEQLQQQVEQQRYVTDQLVTDLPTSKTTRREKEYAILRKAAQDATKNATRWFIGSPKAAGAADCSDRYARKLFRDNLAEEFDFAEYDPEGKPKARLLVSYEDGPEAFLARLPELFPDVTEEA